MNKYTILSEGILRCSNFSIYDYFKLIEEIRNINEESDMISFINNIKKNSRIMLSILQASMSLYNSIKHFDNLKFDSKKEVIKSLCKYLSRIIYRATPYGLFSSVNSIKLNFNDNNLTESLEVLEENVYFSISPEFTFKVYDYICDNIKEFKKLKICSNPNMCVTTDHIKVNVIGEHPDRSEGEIIYISRNIIIDNIIDLLSETMLEIQTLMKKIRLKTDVLESQILQFIRELLNERVLYLEIYPNNFSVNSYENLIEKLALLKIDYSKRKEFTMINNQLNKLNSTITETEYMILFQMMKNVFKCNNYVNCNSYTGLSSSEINLNIKPVKNVIDLLLKIKQVPILDQYFLEKYIEKFIDRYGYNNYVNIFDLFDESRGLGSPFIINEVSLDFLKQKKKYFSKLNELLRIKENSGPCIFDKKFIDEINKSIDEDGEEHWDGFDINFKLISDENEEYLYLDGIATSFNPGGFMGRFNRLKIDEKIINRNTVGEQYWPNNNKLWNVTAKQDPFLRNLVATGYKNNTEDILLKDIYVFVDGNHQMKMCDNKGFPVNVNSLSMANITLKHDLMKFIELISKKSTNIFNFIYSINSVSLDHINRLQINNVILFPESWKIKKSDLKSFSTTSLLELLEIRRIPHCILVNEGDQLLRLNTKNSLDLEIMIDMLNKNSELLVSESFVSNPSNRVTKNGIPIASEVSLSILKEEINNEPLKNKMVNVSNRYENFDGESGWIYFSLYLNKSLETRLLQQLCKNDLFTKNEWFYIRYYDPKPHLRIRVYALTNGMDIIEKIFQIQSNLFSLKLIDDFKINTYYREVERYGYNYINRFEHLFCIDSELCLLILRYEQLIDNNTFMSIVIKVHDIIFSTIFSSINYLPIYFTDFLHDKQARNLYYNKIQNTVPLILLDSELNNTVIEFSEYLKELINEMKGEFSIEYLLEVLDSVFHMHFNRLFGDNKKEIMYRSFIFRYLKRRKRELENNDR